MSRSVAVLVVVLMLPARAVAADKPQQICGNVIAVMCHPPQPKVLTLLVQPGISVDISAKTEDAADKLRSIARGLFFQQACVTGRLTARQDGSLSSAVAAGRRRHGFCRRPGTSGLANERPGQHLRCRRDSGQGEESPTSGAGIPPKR